MIRGYSKDHAIEMGYPLPDYRFPEQPGECDATLTLKVWGQRKDLLCYFDTNAGEKLLLCVWFSIDSSRSYRPRECDLDMSYVEIGSRMRIRYGLSESGKSRFLGAELLK